MTTETSVVRRSVVRAADNVKRNTVAAGLADSSLDCLFLRSEPSERVSSVSRVRGEPDCPARRRRADRIRAWLPRLIGALTLVAGVHAIEPLPVGVFYADAQYMILAKSLVTGQGYRFLNLPGAPFGTHFPPG